MTARYCHPTEADKRLAIERTSEALFPTRHKDANEIPAPDGSERTNLRQPFWNQAEKKVPLA